MKIKIAIIGEYLDSYEPHTSLNRSLEYLKQDLKIQLEYEWIDTLDVINIDDQLLMPYHGIWSAPGSPFKSLEGAAKAIQYARENNIPHLGTCAGFQHTVIEIARNLLGFKEAEHEEYNSDSSLLFVSRLACHIAGQSMTINIDEKSMAYECYKSNKIEENYHCNFGFNPAFRKQFVHPSMNISGVDSNGEFRILEITKNDFFVATLFVPQTRSVKGNPHPLIKRFVEKALM